KNNRFSCLTVEEVSEEEVEQETCEVASEDRKEDVEKMKKVKKPRWEKRLPRAYTIATTPGSRSLRLKVQVQTTDTGTVHGANGLVDCRVQGLFMDIGYAERNGIAPRKLTSPIPVKNVDGTPNESGLITEVVDMVMRYNDHSERVVFAITQLGKEDLILGLPWLKEHNLEVDWACKGSGQDPFANTLSHSV